MMSMVIEYVSFIPGFMYTKGSISVKVVICEYVGYTVLSYVNKNRNEEETRRLHTRLDTYEQ